MYKRFIEFMDNADCLAGSSIVVAAAEAESIKAVKLAMGRGLGYAVLTGDEKVIAPEVEKCGLADKVEIVHADSPQEAAVKACLCVREGRGSALMKGMANTSDFLHAVLSKEYGLRTGRLLSHLAVMEIPGEYHLSFCSDSGLNVAPDLEQKKRSCATRWRPFTPSASAM